MSAKGISDVIAPDDRMYGANRDVYFDAGADAVRAIRWALEVAGKDRVANVLDLPCGHGRVARHLAVEFPDATLHACDLLDDGVRFCAEQFGAHPIYSHEDPEQILLPPVDLIWSGSLLTHLPEDGVRGFLRRFASALTPRGVLVFSVVGPMPVERRLKRGVVGVYEKSPFNLAEDQIGPVVEKFDRDGFAYSTGDLGPHPDNFPSSGFGWTFMSPEWLCRAIAQETDLQLLLYVEGGWGHWRNEWSHDIVACMKPYES